MSYKVGSFNMCNLNYRNDDRAKRNFDETAEIIRRENFDIIAMQEVLSDGALKLILNRLGPNWKYVWEQPKSVISSESADKRGEGYAYIWNSKRIALVGKSEILNRYSELVRPPYYARFSPAEINGGVAFELRLINTHITFGSAEARRNEHRILSEEVYPRIADKRYGNNMPAYTVLLGDYNLNIKSAENNSPYLQDIIIVDDHGRTKLIATVQDKKTTLKQVSDQDIYVTGRYANNYDHFSYDTYRFEGTTINIDRVDALEKYYNDSLEDYRNEISDHVPVKMDFSI